MRRELKKRSRIHPMGRVGGAWMALSVCAMMAVDGAEQTYRHYRFTPTKTLGEEMIQLSEFQFLDSSDAPIDMSGVTATNASGDPADSPGGEQPPSIHDGDLETKWLNWAAEGPLTQGIDFDFGVATTVNGYNFATANDAIGRTPVSWELYGGVDEAPEDGVVESWELLDARADEAINQVLFTYQLGWVIPSGQLPVISSFSGYPEVVLNGDSVELSWEVLDADTVEISEGVGMVGAAGAQGVVPSDNADTTYTLTATNVGGSVKTFFTVRSVAGVADDPPAVAYRYYRFSQQKLRSDAAANSIQMAEFTFLNDGAPVDHSEVVVMDSGNSPEAEGPANLVDGNPATKWLNFDKSAVEFEFPAAVEIDAYAFTTANDSPERDPVQWLLEGSNDGFDWIVIDTMMSYDFPVTEGRGISTGDIPLPGASMVPLITRFIGDAPTLVTGEPLLLTWETIGAVDVTIDQGVGAQASNGSTAVSPTEDTSYTLTANGGLRSVTAEFSMVVVDPAVSEIAYADFGGAGEELALRGAKTINDFANIPEPGDIDRLRLTDDAGGQNAAAWFRKRIDTSAGFDTTFDLHFVTLGTSSGADGIAFILQNDARGTGVGGVGESGLTANALNIKFDSYQNGAEPSAATIEVREGDLVLASADLSTFPEITLAGEDRTDLTDNLGTSVPYPVRVAYTAGSPGMLDVFFQGVQVIGNLEVDLEGMGAVDAAGTGYVGFSARTGGAFEAHDVTSWFLVEGAPVLPELPRRIEILDYEVDFAFDELILTFTSRDFETYRVAASDSGLEDFDIILETGIWGERSVGQTTVVIPFTPTPNLFLRIEVE